MSELCERANNETEYKGWCFTQIHTPDSVGPHKDEGRKDGNYSRVVRNDHSENVVSEIKGTLTNTCLSYHINIQLEIK